MKTGYDDILEAQGKNKHEILRQPFFFRKRGDELKCL